LILKEMGHLPRGGIRIGPLVEKSTFK